MSIERTQRHQKISENNTQTHTHTKKNLIINPSTNACLRMSFEAILIVTVYNGYCAREMLSELFENVFMFKCENESGKNMRR